MACSTNRHSARLPSTPFSTSSMHWAVWSALRARVQRRASCATIHTSHMCREASFICTDDVPTYRWSRALPRPCEPVCVSPMGGGLQVGPLLSWQPLHHHRVSAPAHSSSHKGAPMLLLGLGRSPSPCGNSGAVATTMAHSFVPCP